MANEKPSAEGLVGHYVGCTRSAVEARRTLPRDSSKEAKKAVDDLIVALAGTAMSHIEMAKSKGSN